MTALGWLAEGVKEKIPYAEVRAEIVDYGWRGNISININVEGKEHSIWNGFLFNLRKAIYHYVQIFPEPYESIHQQLDKLPWWNTDLDDWSEEDLQKRKNLLNNLPDEVKERKHLSEYEWLFQSKEERKNFVECCARLFLDWIKGEKFEIITD